MAETDVHREQMVYLIEALNDYFRAQPDIYVAGNLFVYYQEGNPGKRIAPDVFVVKGVPKGLRRIYKLWEEGKGPDVVFEITSRGTRLEDMETKKRLYEMLGVREYFLFDPFGEYIESRLMGYRLEGGRYRLIQERPVVSEELGLELRVEGEMLRLVDPFTGEKLLTPAEAQEARRREMAARRLAERRAMEAERRAMEAERLVMEETEARRRLEKELERLWAELARLRGEEV